jgi:hypothetical protein
VQLLVGGEARLEDWDARPLWPEIAADEELHLT